MIANVAAHGLAPSPGPRRSHPGDGPRRDTRRGGIISTVAPSGRQQMNSRERDVSPKAWARIGGLLYLIVIAAGAGAELLVRDRLIVPGDATATSNNIRASESLWRLGIAANLFHLACA